MRAIIGRAAIAAIEKTARLMPTASPSPPSSSSMNRGRVDTAMPTKTKNARVATVTMTKGALIKRARAESVMEAMMASSTPHAPAGFPDPTDVTAGAAMSTIDRAAVDALLARAHREVDDGLLPSCQLALGFAGEIVMSETIGDAAPDTRYVVYSATKAFVAGAVWAVIGNG